MWGSAQGGGLEGPKRPAESKWLDWLCRGQARNGAGEEGRGQGVWEVEPPGRTTPREAVRNPGTKYLADTFPWAPCAARVLL